MLVVLLLGLGVGVYLVQNRTHSLPFAGEPTTSPINHTQTVKVWLVEYVPAGGPSALDKMYPGIQINDPAAFTKNTLLPAMNNASKYHGYSNPSALPALNYTLADEDIHVVNDPPPKTTAPAFDYAGLFQQYDLCNYAKAHDIKAVMIWQAGADPYPSAGVQESTITGSNGIPTNGTTRSFCPDKTIVIYGFIYTRGLPEAMESYGHHLETVFRKFRPEYASWSDESAFYDRDGQRQYAPPQRGDSCGTVHNPPNARCEYDAWNPVWYPGAHCNKDLTKGYFQTDCRNWKPDGSGAKENVDCHAWGCDRISWISWWMQNMPGQGNDLVGTDGQKIPNWWVYIGDPDNCYNDALGCTFGSPRPPTMTTVSSGCYGPNNTVPYIDLNWNKSTTPNVTLYHIYRQETSGGDYKYIGSANGSQTTFRDTPQFGLANSTTYNYKMQSERYSNTGPTSPDYSNQVTPTSPSCSVSTPTPTPTSQPSPSPSTCPIGSIDCAQPPPNCHYEGGNSCSCGNLVCSSPNPTPTPTTLLPPTMTTVSLGCYGSNKPYVDLNWSPSATPGVPWYYVYRKLVSGGDYQYIGSANGSKTTFRDTSELGLANYTVYSYKMRATSNVGPSSDFSNQMDFRSLNCF